MSFKKIVIGVITYKRGELLLNALQSLSDMNPIDGVVVEIIIVDNDEDGSAQSFVEYFRENSLFHVRYFIEPVRGIPYARNRVIDEANNVDAFALAFFDDDEIVGVDWLSDLYGELMSTGRDVIAGPVDFQFPIETPLWLCKLDVFTVPCHAQGKVLETSATGNVIYRLDVFKRYQLKFDQRFRFRGGSDTFLGRLITSSGGIIGWSEAARVTELVPSSRVNVWWVAKRTIRVSLNLSFQNILLYGYRNAILKALSRFIYGHKFFLLNFVPGLLLNDKSRLMNSITRLIDGYAYIFGVMSIKYNEYSSKSYE